MSKRKEILLVDDEPEILIILTDILKASPERYKLRTATNPKAVFRILEKIRPDLILTDWQMPGMDGLEMLSKIREKYSAQEMPIILMSGLMVSSQNLAEGLAAQANDFLRKPIDRIELLARVKNLLELASSYQKIKTQEVEKRQLLEREKVLLKNKIKHQEEELLRIGIHLQQRSAQVQQFKAQLQELLNTAETLTQLSQTQLTTPDPEKNWKLFRIELEQVHPEFFEQLTLFNLTQNEMRIMAYYRVGLSGKEVAEQLNISVAAAQKARHRLRKKLNLQGESALEEFVMSL